ncbi:DUF5110 domain-containing protein [Muribaculaceae bacterium Isolate-004 (NCI)]|uniref:TIM-barrel domain-containing protein n=1 Tax=Paramuribaculum intestinale TaxID=2094151 RepID=UPI000FFF67A8|nr:TIM-barrel domain-containing protein [Paramuribaculum intestinale]RXE62400.1 DUF5110 domain-containing protein [Muribaculaceae bacterium Isolate-004 (NCI)]
MKRLLTALAALAYVIAAQADTGVKSASLLNPTTAELVMTDGTRMAVDFYGPTVFRLFYDPQGGIIRNPQANPPAEILTVNPRRQPGNVTVTDNPATITIATPAVSLDFGKADGLMTVTDLRRGAVVASQTAPLQFDKGAATLTLAERKGEYFYGGGVQNGRFSHKGRRIAIENQNSWTDGGVSSPTPFYWSTGGYGVLWHTFAKGSYDFGAKQPGSVSLTHQTPWLDIFVMVDETPAQLLADFYQLTGNPVLLPKFGFYEGHLNAYNRDYWTPDTTGKGIMFEDGVRYRESQRDNGGIRESLNGENDNYQFSARAVIDRYAAHDMPLGWLLPNDGYGAGYGQTDSLTGNIDNLRRFGDYARSKGVEIGLWTQSDLHPKEGVPALLQRDIVREVRDAGVRVLKTDVAWVGAGYSFGLNGVSDVGQIMPYYGANARPFIISLDGWAGTQRYAGIWSGDQVGGEWEYIRFHIPTYIGSGLSGQPNISSDMDGIFGGRNPQVNIRDFQWKTFSPMQLNMDGWGSNEKYPHALGEPATSINRNYLKLKSQLLPYAYTYAREAVDGKPLIRAMMLEYPDRHTLSAATRYQYLYGPDFLVAPVYRPTAPDSLGNDIRHGIFLPRGRWIDYFTGQSYEGGRVLNSFDAPIWKLPVFVRAGAIIPMANPSNNPSEIDRTRRIYEIYPDGRSEMTEYDDDGVTELYRQGQAVTTRIVSDLGKSGRLTVTVDPSRGSFDGYDPMKSTELLINATGRPSKVTATVGGRKVRLTEATTEEAFDAAADAWRYVEAPQLNRFSTPGTPAAAHSVVKNPQIEVKIAPTDVSRNTVAVTVDGFIFEHRNNLLSAHGNLTAPVASIPADSVGAYSLSPVWQPVDGADSYEIMFDSLLYANIRQLSLPFADLKADTPYSMKLRAVNADGPGPWTELNAITRTDPLEFALHGLRGEADKELQPGFEMSRLFDFAESGDMMHSRYRADALPMNIVIDLMGVNTLDRLRYLPRTDGGNGTILSGNIAVSLDKQHWTPVDSFRWERNGLDKEFVFAEQPQARYIRLHVDEGVGRYVSGRELYVFKVPGTETYLPGDINADGKVDEADLTSYTNYTGLRRGDSDFEGYISVGDINRNDLIDAFDISNVATRLDGGVEPDDYAEPLKGTISHKASRSTDTDGTELIAIEFTADTVSSLNAISVAIPYDHTRWEFAGIDTEALKGMENLTYDRLHTDGHRELYPTFVNIGERPTVDGSGVNLFTVRFKARRKGSRFDTSAVRDGLIVDKKLNTLPF